jgi:predicted transcriptional regulator YdeE
MGCVSESRRDAINERADSRSNEAMKPPDIVRREGFLVMGTVTRRKPGTERPETFVSAWNEFETHQQRVKRHSVNSKYYGVSFAPGADGSFDYLTGMAVGPAAETPEGVEVRVVPAATYAVFACPVQSIGQTYRCIFGEWRAQSGYTTDDAAPAFEEYPAATDTSAPVLLHIPIREDPAK